MSLTSQSLESAIYRGTVWHERVNPTKHAFQYDIALFWLKLSEIEGLDTLNGLHINRKGWLSFMRKDYCAPHISDLQTAILAKANTLSDGEEITGEVFFLGQTRTLNVYFSPVNFYYIRREGEFSHMLAEVSNTPWNERHYYLVDLKEQAPTQKAFHVSPFNPMDMTYHWQISEPAETLKLVLSCHREDKEFVAGIALKRSELSVKNLRQLRRQIPSMTLKTVIGIYWQAVKLFIKRTPFYGHPGKPDNPPAIQSEK